jgi:GNAT superfamily N-acetyltransferase
VLAYIDLDLARLAVRAPADRVKQASNTAKTLDPLSVPLRMLRALRLQVTAEISSAVFPSSLCKSSRPATHANAQAAGHPHRASGPTRPLHPVYFTGGETWKEPGVDKDRVIARNEVIATALGLRRGIDRRRRTPGLLVIHDHWTIRIATGDDIASVLDLWAAAGSLPSVTDSRDGLARLLAYDPQALLVAERDGVPAGSLIAAGDGWRGSFYRLAVSPEHRRNGLATMLLRAGERRLREWGAVRLTAIVAYDDPTAMSFLAGHGL